MTKAQQRVTGIAAQEEALAEEKKKLFEASKDANLEMM